MVLVECLVQTFKKAMKSYKDASTDTQQLLASFLLTYHSIPHNTTNETPSKLFLGCKIHTRLDLLLPSYNKTVVEHQAQQKSTYYKHSAPRVLVAGEVIMAKYNKQGIPYVRMYQGR